MNPESGIDPCVLPTTLAAARRFRMGADALARAVSTVASEIGDSDAQHSAPRPLFVGAARPCRRAWEAPVPRWSATLGSTVYGLVLAIDHTHGGTDADVDNNDSSDDEDDVNQVAVGVGHETTLLLSRHHAGTDNEKTPLPTHVGTNWHYVREARVLHVEKRRACTTQRSNAQMRAIGDLLIEAFAAEARAPAHHVLYWNADLFEEALVAIMASDDSSGASLVNARQLLADATHEPVGESVSSSGSIPADKLHEHGGTPSLVLSDNKDDDNSDDGDYELSVDGLDCDVNGDDANATDRVVTCADNSMGSTTPMRTVSAQGDHDEHTALSRRQRRREREKKRRAKLAAAASTCSDDDNERDVKLPRSDRAIFGLACRHGVAMRRDALLGGILDQQLGVSTSRAGLDPTDERTLLTRSAMCIVDATGTSPSVAPSTPAASRTCVLF